jgi:uncharacterized protein
MQLIATVSNIARASIFLSDKKSDRSVVCQVEHSLWLHASRYPSTGISRPWPANGARAFIEALLASPGIAILAETDRHATVLREIITEVPDVVGNVLSDLHIAALMREHGIGTIYTRDVDFHRFPFLRVVDPVRGRGN